jgi:thioredoxin reductase (NADPH)
MNIENVVIIGSGPAGYTAAIYTARALLKPLLITGDNKGGQLMMTTDVENYPGFIHGISGSFMMNNLYEQAKRFGTNFIEDNVESIDTEVYPYKIKTKEKEIYTNSIIIATGASSIWLNAENEEYLKSNGVSTCATCDGAFYKDENVIVVGGGDSAMEEALFLTRYAKSVTIVHRRETFKASKIMLEKARNNPKIYWKLNYVVSKWIINDNKELCSVLIKNTQDSSLEFLNCTGGFIAIGHNPNTKFLKNKLKTNNEGFIINQENMMTSVPGIFSCGDVCASSQRYKQAITAAGEGCKAAMDCEKWLENNNL